MNVQRFFGKNSKAALALVREALGEDAIILSNRTVNGGNEIMAFNASDIDTVPTYSQTGSMPMMEVPSIEDAQSSTLEALFRKREKSDDLASKLGGLNFDVNPEPQTLPEPSSDYAQAQVKEINAQMASMMMEIRNMRSVIESQLAEISWSAIQHRDPLKSNMLGTLLSAGFSPALSKQIAEKIPDNLKEFEASQWVQTVLLNNLQTATPEDDMLDKGGIFALIGPTGVGKTTTTAKLAAHYVMKHGTENIGLITTDAYRIGGHEQLRIYGKILGVMVHNVKDEADLKIALNELKNKHTILIDTIGVSQRDQKVGEQIAMLSGEHNIKKLLCLNATNMGDTLSDVVRAYKGQGLHGCVITKIDEAMTIGNVLDVIIREKLKLCYVANGQRVPEDIQTADKQQLIQRAFVRGQVRSSPFRLQNEDLPVVIGNSVLEESTMNATELANA
jgi:flagellar biosynthesis protein FlhF